MSDADEPPICDTLGCENEPIEGGYCAECANISPGILDSDDGDNGASGGGHQASDVSRATDPEREQSKSADSASHSPVEAGSGDATTGFESGATDAHDRGKR